MPRANRYFVPGYIWHITHRCHKKEFLLKFSRDRQRWLHWLFEAKKRYGLCVLNYVVTSNHIHLLVKDTGESVISKSLQLIAGRTAQEYNRRKERKGAYWEDRYHATAIETNEHLFKCLVYINLNMVRAGVVKHPCDWAHGGYNEIQHPPKRYRILDINELTKLCGLSSTSDLQELHQTWLKEELMYDPLKREEKWTGSIAVGSESFIDSIKISLGIKATHKQIIEDEDGYVIKEGKFPYKLDLAGKMVALRIDNTVEWDVL